MREWQGKRYWLVGASEGLGRALALQLSKVGTELVVSARNAERLDELVAELPGRATAVPVDVGSLESVREAARAAGPIDGVIYLAGVYWPFPATAWDIDRAEAMADVNFTGGVRVLGSVMPDFVARDRGHVVIVGSLSGFRGLPGSIGYGSAKAGLMHLAESMYCDLRNTGIEVQLANPGFIRTRLTDKNEFHMPFLMEADDAARAVFEHMSGGGFKRNFPTLFSWLFRGSQFLPDAIYYRIFGR